MIPTLKDGVKDINILNYKIHDDAKSYMVIESVTNTTSKTIHVINFTFCRKIKVVSIINIIFLMYRGELKQPKFALLILV